MKKLVLIAAVVALAACNKAAEEAPAAETSVAANEATGGKALTPPGRYDVVDAKGPVGTTIINADGTYVDIAPDGKEVKGTIASKNGMDCFDPEGEDAEICFTMTAPDADGSFKATTADGETTVTVTPTKS